MKLATFILAGAIAALLVAAALLAHARERTVWTAAWAALAALARPEALLLVPFLALSRGFTLKRAAVFAALVAVTLAPNARHVLFAAHRSAEPEIGRASCRERVLTDV